MSLFLHFDSKNDPAENKNPPTQQLLCVVLKPRTLIGNSFKLTRQEYDYNFALSLVLM